MFESVTCSSAVKSDLCLCTDRSYCGVVYSWIVTTWVCDKACVCISCVVACLVHAAHSRPRTETNAPDAVCNVRYDHGLVYSSGNVFIVSFGMR